MKLLLHGCCADCILKFAQALDLQKIELSVFYYNPNIHPRAEYLSRLKAAQSICDDLKVKLFIPNWSPKEYFTKVKTNQKPARCHQCWQLRLEQTAKFAKDQGFKSFSTTLLTSKYQNADFIKKLGGAIGKKYDIEFFAPKEIPRELPTKGFYKQNYCGCCYSLAERLEEKFKIIEA